MTAILEASGLSKSYSGIQAVQEVSFTLRGGAITGLIGPNGSGKSTIIDCISGFQGLDVGAVSLGGRNVTGLTPQEIARAGLVRTFQTVRVYETYSLLDNLLVVSRPFRDVSWADALVRTQAFRQADRGARARARELIDFVGLSALIDAPAVVLSYGQKKLLAFAAALMAEPALVILDEPVAGVNPTRINEVAEILRQANRAGISFLIVEHNVDFISSLCDPVIVLDQGRKLLEGPPELVHRDRRVLDAYLGIDASQPQPAGALS